MLHSIDAAEKLLNDYQFETILDVGCGSCFHSEGFRGVGYKVTSTDYVAKKDYVIEGPYEELQFEQHDVVWCSHVLEHQLNVNNFLKKLHTDLKDDGILAITVPPAKHEIVGGHVTIWNAGLLLYNLVLAGFDCRDASIKQYGYNISVIAKKGNFELPTLKYDNGDVNTLQQWLPEFAHEGFNGDIKEHNW